MTPKRWQQVKQIFQSALERNPAERSAFLNQARADDVWLSDSRRLLFQDQSKLYLIDSQSKKSHEVLSVAPHEFGNGVTLPRDDRIIYFSLLTTEADIWLMRLND